MIARWILAALHLVALGVGLGAVWARGRALEAELDQSGLRRVFYADNLWGLAALIWILTGLARAFGGFEKGTSYYLHSHLFWTKMALFAVIFVLELSPMITLIRWRSARRRGEQPDVSRAPTLARISFLQAALVVLMVLAATAMARGLG